MRIKYELNKNEKMILKMIYYLSSKKGYLFKDQLCFFLVHFKMFNNIERASEALLALQGLEYIRIKRYSNSSPNKVVLLTHKSGKLVHVDLRDKVEIKDNVLYMITAKIVVLKALLSEYPTDSFAKFYRLTSKNHSNLFLSQSPVDTIKYYKKIKNSPLVHRHVDQLLLEREQQLKSLKINRKDNDVPPVIHNVPELANYINALTLMKKYIYIQRVYYKFDVVEYVKFTPFMKYDRKKLYNDIRNIDKFHRQVFPGKKFTLFVFTFVPGEKDVLKENLDYLQYDPKIIQADNLVAEWKDNVVARRINLDKYFPGVIEVPDKNKKKPKESPIDIETNSN